MSSPHDDRMHDLWARRLAGETLNQAEEKELAEVLASNSELSRELLEVETLDGALRQMGRGQSDGDVFVQRLMGAIDAEKTGSKYVAAATARVQEAGNKRSTRRTSSRRSRKALNGWGALVWLSAAACVVLAIGYWQRSQPVEQPILATLEEIRGSVSVVRSGTSEVVSRMAPLHAAEIVQLGTNGEATVVYVDGTRVTLNANSTVVLQDVSGAKHLELKRGSLGASVAKQRAGAPMLFVTEQAKATVLGTQFELSADTVATRLDVKEGLVRLARAADAAQFADVGAGEFAVAAPAQELRTQKIQQVAVRYGLSDRLVPANGALWGGSFTAAGNEPHAQALTSLEEKIGRKFAVVHQYHTFADTSGNKEFPSSIEKSWAQDGRLLLLSWKPRIGANTLKWSDVAAGKYDTDHVIPTAKKVAAWGRKVLLILHHEPDDEVRETGSGMSASDYIAMWQHVRKRFDEAGAKNVVWVWAVVAGTNDPVKWDALYPGDAYVDWLACSAFNFQEQQWRSLSDATQRFRDWAVRSRKGDRSKPILLGPIGCIENGDGKKPSKDDWYRGLPAEMARIPEVKGLVYFNGKDAKSAAFAIDTSPPALGGYRAAGLDPYFNPDLSIEPKR